MERLLKTLGWIVILGGFAGGAFVYWFVGNQEFMLALLARLVEDPFLYRSYFAALGAAMVVILGCLIGVLYLGLATVLQNGRPRRS